MYLYANQDALDEYKKLRSDDLIDEYVEKSSNESEFIKNFNMNISIIINQRIILKGI